ncbi:hypothetical protein ACTA71_001530 [Dictyostelium dimigraforme]
MINNQQHSIRSKKSNIIIINNIFNKIIIFLSKLVKLLLVTIFTLSTWFTLYHLLQLLTFSTKSYSNNNINNNNINNNNNNNNSNNNNSNNNINNNNINNNINNNNNNNNITTVDLLTGVPTFDQIKDLIFNSVLVSIFIFQHSFMASSGYKSFVSSSNFFRPLQRSMYNFFTSLTIEFLISNWQSIDSFIIWDLSKYESNLSTLRTIFLIIILLEFLLFLNFFEFFGISQVWSDCIRNKEYELPIQEKNRLYSIMRHPNTVSLLIIIWFSSTKMTLDLFTVCTFFTFYLLCGNSK